MKAAFYTLGCKVNQYETESMREQFRRAGFDVVAEDESADVYVVNTCTVTNMADRKSRQYIRKAHKLSPDAVIAVTGCYAQMDKDTVAAIEGVDIVTGTDEKSRILELVQEQLAGRSGNTAVKTAAGTDSEDGKEQAANENSAAGHDAAAQSAGAILDVKPYEQLNKYEELGVISEMEGRTRAFIKIQEGCNRFCSYCIIPYARGKVRSRARDEIVREVSGLIARGYREIVLTGINTALYGTDLGYGGIAPLIESLDELSAGADRTGASAQAEAANAAGCESREAAVTEPQCDFRIRLSSLEPTVVDADYAAGLLKYRKLCHHLHLSAQSGSDHVLAAMNRHYTREDYLGIVRRLRAADPYYGISADIIVGFSGETEEDFRQSVALVREAELIKTHVFKYSPRRGTKAALMADQIDEKVKNERSRVLIDAAEEASRAFREKCAGQTRRVLLEQEEHGMLTGYTDNYIKVYIPADIAPAAAESNMPAAAESNAPAASAGTAKTAAAAQPAAAVQLGDFIDVKLVEPYRDGMLGSIE